MAWLRFAEIVMFDWDPDAGQFFDIPDKGLLVRRAEGDGDAVGSGPASATNAVDVGFRNIWDLVIEDVFQIVDVDAACSDIGCDEHANLAGLEIRQRFLSPVLRFVPMDRLGGDAVLFERSCHDVRAALRARKNECRGNSWIIK